MNEREDIKRLFDAYEAITAEIPHLPIDSKKVALAVHQHRHFWKPAVVKTVLLAESHVFTAENEVHSLITYPDFPELLNCPREFVRVVYCLGAGERSLVNLPKNPTKTQFWKIFASCVSDSPAIDFDGILTSKTPDSLQRLRNKVDILVKLKEKGIWLMDASIVALYGTNQRKPSSKDMDKAIELSWKHYVGPIIERENPENIIVIGKGVAKRLHGLLKGNEVCPQPQARLSAQEHRRSFEHYQKVCNHPDK